MRRIFASILLLLVTAAAFSKDIVFNAGKPVTYSVQSEGGQIVGSALELFAEDVNAVLGSALKESSSPRIIIRTVPGVCGAQGFRIEESGGKLYVSGSDDHGTAYGIMELSRMLGVSPWVWWADSTPARLKKWTVKSGYSYEHTPAVLYRGIFINDEDNGMCPWSSMTFEPTGQKGSIGPKTHEKIFQLLLRLRANLFWPAMHSCSVPFYLIDGNRQMAEKYGITIGTSHCEPMLSNTNGEWSKRGVGEYNYITNKENVIKFWEERVKETVNSNGYYTLGMRGIHDSGMLGVSEDVNERKEALQKVIADQREIISKYVNPDPTKVLQAFIPYKEVLPVYNAGIKVPDDVTLIWCDDNYGYIRHLPTAEEQARSGGNGIYYHVSYWGRPQNQLWLPSTHPALIHEELSKAYNHGIQRYWVINAGDIKPSEMLVEYCLDMAWDKAVLDEDDDNVFMKGWLVREFGEEVGQRLLPVFQEYYRLVWKCRPEMLMHTRIEENSPYYNKANDLPWTLDEVKDYLSRAEALEAAALEVAKSIPASLYPHWYELVEYPCCSLAAMARKALGGQLARHSEMDWTLSDEGHKQIYSLTDKYHSLLDGKWNRMVSVWDRVNFQPMDKTVAPADYHPAAVVASLTSADGKFGENSRTLIDLGHSGNALALAKGDSFVTEIPALDGPSDITLTFIPDHPSDGETLEVEVNVAGEINDIQYQTVQRSEEWKVNIETNEARRTMPVNACAKPRKLTVTANTTGVILDRIIVTKR